MSLSATAAALASLPHELLTAPPEAASPPDARARAVAGAMLLPLPVVLALAVNVGPESWPTIRQEVEAIAQRQGFSLEALHEPRLLALWDRPQFVWKLIPDGADAVIMVEYSTQQPTSPDVVVLNHNPVKPGTNILYQGTTLKVGDQVLQAGHTISPATIGLLAELGVSAPDVHRLANVAILSTGDELVSIDQQPGPGQIRNSNGHLLQSLVRNSGATDRVLGVGRDDLGQLESLIKEGLNCEILVLSGGVSAGVKDLVPQALSNLGVREIFHKVHLKPGKPLWFGVAESDNRKTLVFGLPGNPVSSHVVFRVLVAPWIRYNTQADGPIENRAVAKLATKVKPTRDCLTLRRVSIEFTESGLEAHQKIHQGSGNIASMALSEGMVILQPGCKYSIGDNVEVMFL